MSFEASDGHYPDAVQRAGSRPGAGSPRRALSLKPVLLVLLCSAAAAMAQPGPRAEDAEKEEGIPVTDPLTQEKCASCHTGDAKGNLSRISWLRTTPEGWAQAIRRMVRLNGMKITPDETRHIVRYLGDRHGLAPEEAKPVMYLAERRLINETNIPSESVRGACASCHAFGQPLSWRRSATEWKLLQDLHVALYAQADAQYRRPATDEPGAVFGQPKPLVQKPGAPPVTQGQVALDYLRRTAPLHSAEWTRWAARVQTPLLAGKWLVSAFLPGRGQYLGTMTIARDAADGEFRTATTLRPLAGGPAISRTGTGIVYAGYSWRGRSAAATAATAAPDSADSPTRETMWFSPDRRTAEGRWFWGEYQEFGFDVKLVRADGGPAIAGVWPGALKAGARGVSVHIYGDSLPAAPTVSDIDLGKDVTVTKLISARPDELVVTVDVEPDAMAGRRDVSVGSGVLGAALPVYRRVDYIKVTPETALSRLGGGRHPKGYSQFDAWGFDNGADGKPYTEDDVNIGLVAADWSIQEFQQTWYDDDRYFVGTLGSTALFTPNSDGPNPERSNLRNNYGDVWVVATARTEKDSRGRPLTGKAFLVVTVPSYKRFDQPEVFK